MNKSLPVFSTLFAAFSRSSYPVATSLRSRNVIIKSRNCLRWQHSAAVLHEFGKPLVIETTKETRKLRPNEVRIRVKKCGVNNSDVLLCNGQYDVEFKLPYIPGFEIAGEILDVGKETKEFVVGDRVVALSKELNGGFSEECIVSHEDAWKLPSSIPDEIAAALVDSYATAYIGLVRRAEIQQDQIVLVTAAAGGLGLAAVDLAANVYKAKVIGVCGTADKAELVRSKGAWAALTYKRKEMVQTVMKISEDAGAHVVFDGVGGEVFQSSLECVAHEGNVIVAGFASRQVPQIETSLLLPKSCALIGVSLSQYSLFNPDAYRNAVGEVIDMCSEGLIEPHISATFKLNEVNDAFAFMTERKSTGKIVLDLL